MSDYDGPLDDRPVYDYSMSDAREAAQPLIDEVQKLLDDWKRNHAFMFVKRRDDEDWQALKAAIEALA